MGWEAWFTLLVVAAVLVLLVREVTSPSAAMTGGMVAVLVTGVVTPAEALSGFSNPAPITVAALYVLARAVEKTGVLNPLVRFALGDGSSPRRSLARMVVPTSAVSAFLNNTPVVAMLIPEVSSWAEERELSPSIYLMPLSFAALLGGVVTVIGTSTNIVVSGLLVESGSEPFGFFELGRVGLPIAVGGAILLVVFAPRLLRARRSARQELEEEARSFIVDMRIERGGPLDGQAVEKAGLRHLRTTFLAALERDGDLLAPVTPETVLHGGDRLRFVGKVGDVMDLQTIRGLASAEHPHLVDMDTGRARYFEVVVGPQSPLMGKTLMEVGFRERYQAVVLAIHRASQRIDAKLGQVRLRVGDTLLLLADPGFGQRWRDRTDFLMISGGLGSPPVAIGKAWAVGAVALGIISTAATGILPILHASLLGALILVGIGVLTPGEARSAVDLDVVLLIASAFGLAAAIETSGLADVVSGGLVGAFEGLGDTGVLLGMVVATVVLTGLVTNNAAALLMFPIALSTTASTGVDIRPLAVTIAVSASMDFLTPIGYQTNTMVYGPGGYRFFDYTRLGAPLTLLTVVIIVILVPVAWPL
jgi:di/tricarboxylate transporter